jgi:integrase
MPRKKKPGYWRHRPSGQAYVRIDGKDHYLGPYDSPESRDRYDEIVRGWTLNQSADRFAITIDELALRYIQHCESYYRKHGAPTTEVGKARKALKVVITLSGQKRIRDFGPQNLLAVRDEMIGRGWRRITINQQIGRIRRCFKWGVLQELVPPEVLTALETVPGLRAGRSEAKESNPVRPVSLDAVDAIRPFVGRQVWAMIQLQLLTGMRPGEATQMRGCDLTMGGKLWEYRPASHKTEHHSRGRVIILGAEAQKIVREFLRTDTAEFLFRPEDSRREFEERRKAARKTPMSPSHMTQKRKAKPKRKPGEKYRTASYGAAIRKACERAFDMPRELRNVATKIPEAEREQLQAQARAWREQHTWHPHQLRHTAATEIRRTFGLEAAQVALGHAAADVTQIYAERDLELARKVAAKLG